MGMEPWVIKSWVDPPSKLTGLDPSSAASQLHGSIMKSKPPGFCCEASNQ